MTTAPRTILAFDYGTKRIGVAVGQELTGSASPVTTLHLIRQQIDWQAIDRLVKDWQPQALVVGLPVNEDGTEHRITQAAKQFGNQLENRYNLTLYWQDERLTSHEAERIIAANQTQKNPRALRPTNSRERKLGGRKQNTGEIDQTAAMLILESWLNQQRT